MKKHVLLIAFHNQKALGIKFLSKSLEKAGIETTLLYLKGFNSVRPSPCTEKELDILSDLIKEKQPTLIALSAMSTMYLETVHLVNNTIKERFPNINRMWGGIYPTLFPEDCLDHVDFVIRSEGEEAIVDLTNALADNENYENIENLAYIKNGEKVINPNRRLVEDLDTLGCPDIGGDNHYYIYDNTLFHGDPILKSINYEMSASRGCPFVCTYCSAININRVANGKYVRFRSVDNVMQELNDAKKKIKNLKVIHFWDEIFSDDPNWVEEFERRYKKEINLPFEIWGHPLRCDKKLIKSLVNAGLYKVVMGIQSGSPYIRKDVFHRPETDEEILKATKVLTDCKVPQVIYDFMLQHEFETEETMNETYEFVNKMHGNFELQLHGMKYFPGTDVVQKAIDAGHINEDEMQSKMYGNLQEEYDNFWGQKEHDEKSMFWYALIYLSQFKSTKKKAREFANNHNDKATREKAMALYNKSQKLAKIRYYYKKIMLVLRSVF